MSFIGRILRKDQKVIKAKMIEATTSFSAYNGDAYSSDVFREAVDSVARNAGKLKGSHIVRYPDHKQEIGDSRLNRLLQIRPNPIMSSYDFIYNMVTKLFLYNNSFAFIDRDDRGNVLGFYPIGAVHVDIVADQLGRLFCCFSLKDGSKVHLPYSDIVHLRRFFRDDLLGADNSAIAPGLELAQTENEGIIAGIRSGATIRGILKFTQLLSPEKLKKEKEAFVSDYLQIGNDGGVIAVDEKMTYEPIESKPLILNADQAKAVRDKIFAYVGTNEQIVSSNYTEDQFSAFYESTIEPISTALSQEMTAKVFTDRELSFGNEIIFESGRLQFTSNSTKVNLIAQLMPMGLLTVNQALEILNLPAVTDGDRRLQALNMISADHATEYQLKRLMKDGDQK